MRQNRLHKLPIIAKKELEKKTVKRGTMEAIYKEDQVLVAWKDNKAVYMASNKYSAETATTVRRFCRKEKKQLQVPIPEMIKEYNSGMGGVDYIDNSVACYRVAYRIKKWYFPIYTWTLSTSAINAWRLRMQMTGRKEPYLDFLRELCIDMMNQHGCAPSKNGRKSSLQSEQRFDRLDHWPVSTEQDEKGQPKRRNCKMCSLDGKKDMKTLFMCEKCKVPLHQHCFKEKIHSNTLLHILSFKFF